MNLPRIVIFSLTTEREDSVVKVRKKVVLLTVSTLAISIKVALPSAVVRTTKSEPPSDALRETEVKFSKPEVFQIKRIPVEV